jgi:hypothetical protein
MLPKEDLKIYFFLISFKKLNNIFNNFIYSKLWYSICGDLVIKLRLCMQQLYMLPKEDLKKKYF